jgi:hypothetical protein
MVAVLRFSIVTTCVTLTENQGAVKIVLNEISLNVRLDKTTVTISSLFNVNLIENFKSICRVVFYRISPIFNNVYIHKITGVNIRGVGFF